MLTCKDYSTAMGPARDVYILEKIFIKKRKLYKTHPSWRIVWIWPIYKTNDLYPANLWYFRYPKQKRSKFFNQDFFCNLDFKIPHFFPIVFSIAILQLSHFREFFTILLASSDRMYLESYNFLRFFFDIYFHQLVKKVLEKVAPLSHKRSPKFSR